MRQPLGLLEQRRLSLSPKIRVPAQIGYAGTARSADIYEGGWESTRRAYLAKHNRSEFASAVCANPQKSCRTKGKQPKRVSFMEPRMLW
jgi:hypothetical protein